MKGNLYKYSLGLLVILLCWFPETKGEPFRFDNYQVYAIKINDQQQLGKLNAFIEGKDLLIEGQGQQVQIWREARQIGDIMDVMVAPEYRSAFEKLLLDHQMEFSLKIDNVQRVIDSQLRKASAKSSQMDWTRFNTLDEIYAWLDMIEMQFKDVVTPFVIGKSYEGRTIRGIKISFKPGNKAVFIESNIHAREWITSASITFFIDQLLASRLPNVRDIATNLDWYIIPVLNVDGFVYSHDYYRLWRKSRLPSDPTGKCIGTDLNRNFDFLWGYEGASLDPCSETYAGPFAESDPEIKQMLQFINSSIPEDTIRIYISLHSYGQYVLSPWGHTDEEFPDNYSQMMAVAEGFSTALARKFNTTFTYGSSATTLYKVSGSGKEWAYGVKRIPIPYTIELRDKGQYGFILPPEDIIPVSRELVDGFVGLVFAARENGVF